MHSKLENDFFLFLDSTVSKDHRRPTGCQQSSLNSVFLRHCSATSKSHPSSNSKSTFKIINKQCYFIDQIQLPTVVL